MTRINFDNSYSALLSCSLLTSTQVDALILIRFRVSFRLSARDNRLKVLKVALKRASPNFFEMVLLLSEEDVTGNRHSCSDVHKYTSTYTYIGASMKSHTRTSFGVRRKAQRWQGCYRSEGSRESCTESSKLNESFESRRK